MTDDRVGIEFDIGWATAGGVDPCEYIESFGDRLAVLHVKDVDIDERVSVEVGEGDVDIRACAEAAREQEIEWYIYEHDEPTDPLASLVTGADFLAKLR